MGVIAIAGLFAIRKYLLTNDNSSMNITSIHYEECDDIACYKDYNDFDKNKKRYDDVK